MFKNLMNFKNLPRNQAANLFSKSTPKRFFSYKQMPNGGPGVGAFLGVGLGAAGLMYLMYKGRSLAM